MSEVHTRIAVDHNFATCCDAEASRYALGNIQVKRINKASALAIATDGCCASVVKIGGEFNEDEVFMPGSLLAKKMPTFVTGNGTWQAVKRDRKGNEEYWNGKEADGRFPKIKDVVPATSKGELISVSINPDLIAQLAKALDCKKSDDLSPTITLIIDTGDLEHAPIRVVGPAGVGVLMPKSGHTAEKDKAAFDAVWSLI
jgi:hypothetical protein